MTTEYIADICHKLQAKFHTYDLHRPMRISRYDAGTELVYNVSSIEKPDTARVRFLVERFIGGGFAGQVYRVKVLDIQNATGPVGGLERGGVYAMKILVPPSGFSRVFRNFLYAVGFQGPFQLQVNPAAARAGALWQKIIRRAAEVRFGDGPGAPDVVDVHATFVDDKIGSCGEISEWIDGRTWRLEVDDRLDLLKRWRRGRTVDLHKLGSPEYRAKKLFMAEFVKLLSDIGAYELARQYEWWTCKSQPNCLKRSGNESDPAAGLVAVDFRPGLALLPILPMSPGDFTLIAKGIRRGSIVQFDRGDISKLEAFIKGHSARFADMRGILEELKADERIYRDSIPDIAQNDLRLLYDKRLWSTILDSAVTGWKVRNLIDEGWEKKLRGSKLLTVLFIIVGLIPFLGKIIRRIWANNTWRSHYASIFTGWNYFCRAVSGKIMENAIDWYRSGRLSAQQTIKIAQQPWRFLYHLPFLLLVLPGLHRFITDSDYRRKKLVFIFIRPFRLYFNAAMREQWLLDMVAEGQKKHILTDDDAATVLSQVNEPYIQKYLVSLVVHLLMMPTTHIVAIICAIVYVHIHPELPRAEAWAVGIGIVALFQVIPVSPGSLCRGLYVLYLVISERNFKDYNIAVFLAFFKYFGYLSFPIQMTYRYPALARFMAGHWATEMVHVVPVFGEGGALLEHWVFGLFYNWPLTIRRRMQRRAELRAAIKPRYRHIGWIVPAAAVILGIADFLWLRKTGQLPHLSQIWWLVILVPAVAGIGTTLGCGGAVLWRRIVASTVAGILTGALYTGISAILAYHKATFDSSIAAVLAWRMFLFAVLTAISAIITELKLPDPDLGK
jgi:hypothetical protein